MNLRIALSCSLLIVASAVNGQVPQARASTPAEVMARLRNSRGVEEAVQLLRDAGTTTSRQFKSDLADSLMQAMLGVEDARAANMDARVAGLALGLSGISDGGGVPFAGAATRLRAVALMGNASESASATGWLSRFYDKAAAVRHLGEVMRLPNYRAYDATQVLLHRMGPEGIGEVKRAFQAGAIRDPGARGSAAESARNGWKVPAEVPPGSGSSLREFLIW